METEDQQQEYCRKENAWFPKAEFSDIENWGKVHNRGRRHAAATGDEVDNPRSAYDPLVTLQDE
jgi:hypothetical protein